MKFNDTDGREFLQTAQYVLGGLGVTSGERSDRFGAFANHPGRRQRPTAQGRTALEDRLVKQTLAHRRQQVVSGAGAPRALAEYRHLPGIAAEFGHVVPDPAQRRHLVFHAQVARQNIVLGAGEPCTKPDAVSSRRSSGHRFVFVETRRSFANHTRGVLTGMGVMTRDTLRYST